MNNPNKDSFKVKAWITPLSVSKLHKPTHTPSSTHTHTYNHTHTRTRTRTPTHTPINAYPYQQTPTYTQPLSLWSEERKGLLFSWALRWMKRRWERVRENVCECEIEVECACLCLREGERERERERENVLFGSRLISRRRNYSSYFLSQSLSFFLSLSLSLTYTHTHTHTHSLTLSFWIVSVHQVWSDQVDLVSFVRHQNKSVLLKKHST